MKVLLLGGTGVISLPITQALLARGDEVHLLNRGQKALAPQGAKQLTADIHDVVAVSELMRGQMYDAIVQFVAYTEEDILRDIHLFLDHTRQYIFISSASAYQAPPRNHTITESTPLYNPYWQYSRDKIAAENVLQTAYQRRNFPMTIVRPSHTYSHGTLPIAIHGGTGPWPVIERIRNHKPVLVPGDGTSLWTVTWSEDFAQAFIGLVGNEHAIGEAVHITSDEVLTWNQIYRILAEALGEPFIPCYVPSDLLALSNHYDYLGSLLGDKAHCAVFDNSKIKRLVPGFTARTRFDQGARLSLATLLDTPEKQVSDPAFDAFSDQVVALMQQAGQAIAQL